jgi:hypothetical protein
VCVCVGNQQRCGVVIVRVRTDTVRSLHHQRRDLHQSTYPVPLRRSGLILLSSGIIFWVSCEVYLCVFYFVYYFHTEIHRKSQTKKIHIFRCPITLRATNFRFSYFVEFVSIMVESCCWLDSCSQF